MLMGAELNLQSVESLVHRHENRLYRTALAILANKADAEDIVHEAFIKYMQKNPAFESAEHEQAWLMRVTINLCRSRLRSSWWRKTVPLIESYPASEPEQGELVETIMSLPPKYRTVIHLYYYEDYSTPQISAMTGQGESTVRSLLARARSKLKVLLKGEEQ